VSPHRTPAPAGPRVGGSASAILPSGGVPRAVGEPGCNNRHDMEPEPRRLRADAERNRQRLIAAAIEMFGERGLEVGVAEIAERAGVGRATLFRNFPSKEALVAAVVVERLRESVVRGRAALEDPDPAEALFGLIDSTLERQQTDRSVFEALADTWMANPEIHAAHREMVDVLALLLERAQAAGAVRRDVSAVDVLLLVKGVCETAHSFRHVDPEVGQRQLDLVRAAITAEDVPARPLRGRPPTTADLDRAVSCCISAEQSLGEASLAELAG
jgi:AcrR family transcriptional regulator